MSEKAMSENRFALPTKRNWHDWQWEHGTGGRPICHEEIDAAIEFAAHWSLALYDEIDRLRAQAKSDWPLLEATYQYLVDMGPCDDAPQPDESPYCGSDDCSYCTLAREFQVVYPKRLATRSKP